MENTREQNCTNVFLFRPFILGCKFCPQKKKKKKPICKIWSKDRERPIEFSRLYFVTSPISLTNTCIWILLCSFVWWFFLNDSSGNIWTMRIRFGRKSVFGVFHIKDTFVRAIYLFIFLIVKIYLYICIWQERLI